MEKFAIQNDACHDQRINERIWQQGFTSVMFIKLLQLMSSYISHLGNFGSADVASQHFSTNTKRPSDGWPFIIDARRNLFSSRRFAHTAIGYGVSASSVRRQDGEDHPHKARGRFCCRTLLRAVLISVSGQKIAISSTSRHLRRL